MTTGTERIRTHWNSLSTGDQARYRYETSLAQMASEAYGLRPGMSDQRIAERLSEGNSIPDPARPDDPTARIGNQRMTSSQVDDFMRTYRVVAASSETSAAGVLH